MTKINDIEDQTAFTLSNTQDLVYKFLHSSLCQSQQILSSYSGFILMINEPPRSLTIVAYYPVIQKPITEYSTFQEVLWYSEEASSEVGQSVVIIIFDLEVCMKTYPVVWNSQEKYKYHIIMIGTFHLIMAYFKMTGKKMAASGFNNVLLEGGMITTGPLTGVINGKNYSPALNSHKTLTKAIFWLLFIKFLKNMNCQKFEAISQGLGNKVLYIMLIKIAASFL